MKRIIVSGCNGKMGHVLVNAIQERHDCAVVAGFDIKPGTTDDFPVITEPESYSGTADVLIDFSHPSFTQHVLKFAAIRNIPTVIATTGFSSSQIEEIGKFSKRIPVFFSANMSLGINLLTALAKAAASVLSDNFDIEIVEAHHNQKIDAPSGTAIMIADGISSVLKNKPQYVYDRHSQRKKREKDEIGIHSIRGGTIVGEHEVVFAGNDEILTLKHTAMSKKIFANGAINAAIFLCGQKPGLYDMSSLVNAKGGRNEWSR